MATYFPDGKYNFKGAGQHGVGMYAIEGANICVVFITPAGSRRCDQFALIDGEYFLVEEGGRRFKVATFALWRQSLLLPLPRRRHRSRLRSPSALAAERG